MSKHRTTKSIQPIAYAPADFFVELVEKVIFPLQNTCAVSINPL
jgi:hypothetical protein